ncbi:uncharacterized protein LOC128957983 [Oppia nitens]|uniref:uncharacterized protein LOC128957983 n=1 Tax=Oppia nitens TaxID=1686743 RepID=UPI0023DB8936|nr:uncharacterized protein LOC128957983 [Oppia nitens]
MQKFLVFVSIVITYSESAAYSGSSGSSGGYGSVSSFGATKGDSGGSFGGGYGGGGGGGGGSSQGFGNTGPIEAAIETHRTVEIRPVQIPSEPAQPQVIEVPSEDLPVTVHFKSQSSRVFVQQTHIPGVPGETEHTQSEDEPHRVVHEVVKPVIQEVREIIQPYRRLVQQIQPVIEQTHTIIAKGEPRQQSGSNGVVGPGVAQISSQGSGTGAGYSSFGGSSSYGSTTSGTGGSIYSSRSASLLSPSSGTTKDRTVSVDSTGASNSRIKFIDSSSLSSDTTGTTSVRRSAIVLIACLSLSECFGNGFFRNRKSNRRMGYGYEPMSSYESMGYDSYEPYKSYGEELGHDLLSEYTSDYGIESYGGGYDSYSPKGMKYMSPPKYSDYGNGKGGGGYGSSKPPIYMKKSYEMAPLYGKGYGKQYDVKVPTGDSPVKVMFLTQHTPVHIQQKHKRGQPEYKKSTTHENPSVVVHEVIKPVIQEIREIIVPYRKVIQKIEPVKEEVKTIVAKKDGKEGYDRDEDDDEDDKYKKWIKKDDDNEEYKKYRKYQKDDEQEDKYKKYQRDDDDSDKYKKYMSKYKDDDKSDRSGYSYQYYEQMKTDNSNNNQQSSGIGVLSSLAGFTGNSPTNNGLTLAAIYGSEQQNEKKSS